MEDQKRRVGMLEQGVSDAKMMYSDALKNLEKISDEIHQQRRDARLRKEMGTRGAGVGAEEPNPAPHDGEGPVSKHGHLTVNRTNSQTQTDDSEMLEEISDLVQGGRVVGGEGGKSNGDLNQDDVFTVDASNLVVDVVQRQMIKNSDTPSNKVKHQTSITQIETRAQNEVGATQSPAVEEPSATAVCGVTTTATPASLFKHPLPVSDSRDRQYLTVGIAADDTETISETVSSTEMLTPGSGPSSVQTTAVTSPETEHSPEAHVESTRTNMEIMETLQKAKNFKSPFLRPNRSRDDLLDDAASDNESIPGSMASVSVLDDDQIESLMLETGDFVSFLARQDEGEVDKIKSMTLPAKLSYLQNYMSFKPEFIETHNAGAVGGEITKDGYHSDSTDCGGIMEPSSGGDMNELVLEPMQQQIKSLSGEDVTGDIKKGTEISRSSQQELVIDSTEYDACWSCEIDMDDLPQKRGDLESVQVGTDTTDFATVDYTCTASATAPTRVSRGYSFEEDSELQRVYRELSAFEKLMRSSSSESPPPQSPPVILQHAVLAGRSGSEDRPHLEIVSEDSVQITVTAAESSPECQKDPLGVMPIRAIANVGCRVAGASVDTSVGASSQRPSQHTEKKEDSVTTDKASPSPQVDKIEHFV